MDVVGVVAAYCDPLCVNTTGQNRHDGAILVLKCLYEVPLRNLTAGGWCVANAHKIIRYTILKKSILTFWAKLSLTPIF